MTPNDDSPDLRASIFLEGGMFLFKAEYHLLSTESDIRRASIQLTIIPSRLSHPPYPPNHHGDSIHMTITRHSSDIQTED